MPSLTARFRLTLLYSILCIGTGAVLLGLTYVLVQQRLRAAPLLVSTAWLPTAPANAPVLPLAGQPITITAGVDLLTPFAQAQQQVVETTLREIIFQSGIALTVMTIVAIGIGWVMSGRVLRPVQRITAVARRLSERNLHERIALQGPNDELKELADTFDMMLSRLDNAFVNQNRFIANASHELRTPLTIMRTEIDVTLSDPQASIDDLRAMADTIRTAVDRSERLIEGLLLLARSEQRIEHITRIDLADAVTLALGQVAAEVRTLNLSVTTDLMPAVTEGNRPLIERLVANLIENAVRHNHQGGWLRVSTHGNDTHAYLRVVNSGVVVPPAEIEGLFLPFRRLHGERTQSQRGVGLGLSIVQAITVAHNGVINAQAVDGGGLLVDIALPCQYRGDFGNK